MRKIHERFVTDRAGRRTGVLLDMEDYEKLLQELESLKAYDAAKASGDEAIPLDQALAEIEELR